MAESATAVERATQKGRLLRIETVLDGIDDNAPGDPLLLIKFDGEEEVSNPYAYDVVMYRSAVKNKAKPIDPKMLIGTKALIHVRGEDMKCEQLPLKLTRQGIFLTFEQLETEDPDSYVKFAGRLVPPFKLLEFESGFRVFERISVLDIIKQVLKAGTTIPIDTLDFSALDREQQGNPKAFPRLEYCVQFGETSFNFVSRLMAEYGIWYYYGQNEVDRDPDSTVIHNEIMIFGHNTLISPITRSESLGVHMRISNEPPTFAVDIPIIDFGGNEGWTVSSWRRTTTPPSYVQLDAGNFNQLNPADPIDAVGQIVPVHDSFTRTNVPAFDRARLLRQIFPTPSESNDRTATDGKGKEFEGAKQQVSTRFRGMEANISLISGISKNPTFISGCTFNIDKDLTDREPIPDGSFTGFFLRGVNTSAYDLNYVFITPGMILSDVWDKSTSQFKAIDSSMATVAQGLQEWMQNYVEGQIDFDIKQLVQLDSKFYLYNLAGGLSYALTSSLATLGSQLLHDLLDRNNGYSNSFVCCDIPSDTTFVPPLPKGIKPRANGPHLALVIGPKDGDELDTSQGDIFHDSFGRVRVRFPWDNEHFLLRPDIGGAVVRPAAWVRVAESWAGRQFGSQYLPRIGQEVIVEFLDGDPDRPIIVGRVYNADHGFVNLPFPARQVDMDLVDLDDWLNPIGQADFRFVGLKTSSTPKPSPKAKERYHLLRYDETYNCEQWLIRSQGRLDVTAFAHSFWTTYGNQHIRVVAGKDKDNKSFGGAAFTTVGGEYDLHIGDSRYEGVEKQYQLSVKAKTLFDLQADHNTVVGGESTLNAKDVVIEAPVKITLKVGNSFVVLDPAGVWIQGPVVMINSGGSPGATTDQDVTDAADAQAAEPGDQWNKRLTTCDPHPAGGGGGRRHHTATAKHGLPVTFNPATQTFSVGAHGRIQVDGRNKGFADGAISDLALIDQTQIGHDRLQSLDNSGHTVKVQQQTPGVGNVTRLPPGPAGAATRQPGTPGTLDAAGNPIPGAGTGGDSTVLYSPGVPAGRTNRPSDVGLFHELTHADHAAHGTVDTTPRADNFDNNDDFNTIPDDNTYRDQRGPWPGMPAPPGNHRADHHDL